MAEIDIERKSGMAWLWWLLGALAVAVVIWMIAAGGANEADAPIVGAPAVVDEAQPGATPPTPVAPTGGIPVAQIMESPAAWTGRTVAGEVQVEEVPTDRGFWITDQGQRLFVILGDQPAEQPKDINPDQTLRLTEAVVYGADQVGNIPGQLDADTRRIVDGQPAVLFVDERNVEILGQR